VSTWGTTVRRSRASFLLAAAFVAAAMGAFSRPARAEPEGGGAPASRVRDVLVIDVEGEIEAPLRAYVLRQLEEAKADQRDCVVLRIDSPGGTVRDSQKMGDAVLALPKSIRTIAWVTKEAISGAAMLALSCDEIVMGPHATIGDCQPILRQPEGGFVPAGEKIETYVRSVLRKYATENGYPVLLAEKMVSKDVQVVRLKVDDGRVIYADGKEFESARATDYVAGIEKSRLTREKVVAGADRLLTMTTDEAKEFGFVSRVFPDEAAFLAAITAPGAKVSKVEMTLPERAGRWLLGVAGVLGGLVMLCLAITMFNGIGTATFVGLVSLVLMLLIAGTADMALGFPLLLLGVGAILLAAEAILIPGFGIAGIFGIVLAVAGLLFLGTGYSPGASGSLDWDAALTFLAQLGTTIAVATIALIVLVRFAPGLPIVNRWTRMVAPGMAAGAAVDPVLASALAAGATGVAATDLRPAGRADVRGTLVDVTSEGDFVEAGAPLRIVRVEGNRVVVRRDGPAAGGGAPA